MALLGVLPTPTSFHIRQRTQCDDSIVKTTINIIAKLDPPDSVFTLKLAIALISPIVRFVEYPPLQMLRKMVNLAHIQIHNSHVILRSSVLANHHHAIILSVPIPSPCPRSRRTISHFRCAPN